VKPLFNKTIFRIDEIVDTVEQTLSKTFKIFIGAAPQQTEINFVTDIIKNLCHILENGIEDDN